MLNSLPRELLIEILREYALYSPINIFTLTVIRWLLRSHNPGDVKSIATRIMLDTIASRGARQICMFGKLKRAQRDLYEITPNYIHYLPNPGDACITCINLYTHIPIFNYVFENAITLDILTKNGMLRICANGFKGKMCIKNEKIITLLVCCFEYYQFNYDLIKKLSDAGIKKINGRTIPRDCDDLANFSY